MNGWKFFHGTPLTPAVWDEVRAILPPFEGLHVVGHSLGGQQALGQDASRLTLLCTRATPYPPFWEAARRVRQGQAGEEAMERWFTLQEREAGGPLLDYARKCLREADRPSWAADLESIARFSFDLSTISVPVLLIAAERDPVSTPEVMAQMAAALPNARFVLWPGAAHMSPFLYPERLAELLTLRW